MNNNDISIRFFRASHIIEHCSHFKSSAIDIVKYSNNHIARCLSETIVKHIGEPTIPLTTEKVTYNDAERRTVDIILISDKELKRLKEIEHLYTIEHGEYKKENNDNVYEPWKDNIWRQPDRRLDYLEQQQRIQSMKTCEMMMLDKCKGVFDDIPVNQDLLDKYPEWCEKVERNGDGNE